MKTTQMFAKARDNVGSGGRCRVTAAGFGSCCIEAKRAAAPLRSGLGLTDSWDVMTRLMMWPERRPPRPKLNKKIHNLLSQIKISGNTVKTGNITKTCLNSHFSFVPVAVTCTRAARYSTGARKVLMRSHGHCQCH